MSRRRDGGTKPELEAALDGVHRQLEEIGEQLAAKAERRRGLVTAAELAPLIHKPPRYLLRHWRQFPFARRLPWSREILFDLVAFEEFLANLQGPTR